MLASLCDQDPVILIEMVEDVLLGLRSVAQIPSQAYSMDFSILLHSINFSASIHRGPNGSERTVLLLQHR